ncbi:hypothetical protein M3J09_010665 [Ascochyta lentis]
MRVSLMFLGLASASIIAALPHPFVEDPVTTIDPQVTLNNGTVTVHHIESYKQDDFLGIPFAEPPIGPLRFSLPRPVKNVWERPFTAQSYPHKCAGYGAEQIGDFKVSEDCLYLNVVKPTGFTSPDA